MLTGRNYAVRYWRKILHIYISPTGRNYAVSYWRKIVQICIFWQNNFFTCMSRDIPMRNLKILRESCLWKAAVKNINQCSLDVLPANIVFLYFPLEWNMFGRYVKYLYALQWYLKNISPLNLASYWCKDTLSGSVDKVWLNCLYQKLKGS